MLKSRGRTVEAPVMEAEEWPQVVQGKFEITILHRISSMTKSVTRRKAGDAYAKTKKGKM